MAKKSQISMREMMSIFKMDYTFRQDQAHANSMSGKVSTK